MVPLQAIFPGRRHHADAHSAIDSGQLREATALTTAVVEASDSGLALGEEIDPLRHQAADPALGPARRPKPVLALNIH